MNLREFLHGVFACEQSTSAGTRLHEEIWQKNRGLRSETKKIPYHCHREGVKTWLPFPRGS